MFNVASVSRQHARVRLRDGRCLLSDAGSRFGTRLNGVSIKGEMPLQPGDVFDCGQVSFALEQSVGAQELLSEDHQLLEDSGTLLRRLDLREIPNALNEVPSAATPEAGNGGSEPPALKRAADPRAAWPALDRRLERERRQSRERHTGKERRAGRERRQSRFLRLLTEIGKTLVTVQPLPLVLARVVDLVFDAVPAERAFLLLRDGPDQALTARVLRNRDGSAPAQTTLSRTVINHVMRARVAMLASDALCDPRLDAAGSIQAMSVRSFMCAPL